MTIGKPRIKGPLKNISTDRMLMPASRKKRQDWNVVNNYSTQSTINILTKEKKLCEQKTKTITVIGVSSNKNKWNETIRKQKGVKLGFGPTKKWDLKVNKEIDLEYEQESDDVIINDDYNNVKGPEMRPVTATIIKVKEEEDTSSVSSYDVFQNVIIKRTGYEFGLGGSALKKGGLGGYGAYQLGLGSGGIGGIGLLKDRKDFEFGMNGMGVGKRTLEFGMSGIGGGKRTLEFGMTGIGGGTSLIDRRNLDYGIGGIGFGSGLRERKDLEFGIGGLRTSPGLIRDKKILDFGISNVGVGSGLLKDKSGFGYEFSLRNGGGSGLLQTKEGLDVGLGMSGEKVRKSGGVKYEYEYLNPSNSKTVITQTKIINEKSPRIYNSNGNILNSGISMSKNSYGDITKNVTEENIKLANLPTLGEQGKQNVFKLRVSSTSENEQKNKYDKTVKSLASQTKNLIGNGNINTMSASSMNAGMNIRNSNSMNAAMNSMNANNMSSNSMNVMNAAMSNMNAMGSINSMNSMNAAMNSMNAINNTMNAAMNSKNVRNMNMGMNMGMNMRDTRNIIIGDKKMKKIEFVREEPEQKNYLKV